MGSAHAYLLYLMQTIKGNLPTASIIGIEQLKLLNASIPYAITAQILSGLIVITIQWSVIEHGILYIWFAAILLTGLARIVLSGAFLRRVSDEYYQMWQRRFVMMAGLSGLVWGSAGVLLFPEENLSHQTFVGFAMVGVATGAVVTQAFLRQAMFAFVIPIMLGLSAGFFLTSSPIGYAVSAAALLLLSILLIAGNRIYRSSQQNIEYRLKSEAQISAFENSQQRMRTILDTAADAFFLYDEQGRFLDVNEQACLNLGYTRPELLQLSVADIELTANKQDVEQHWDELKNDKASIISGIHRRKDGTTFPVEVRLGVVHEGGEKLFSVLARDVTERKKVEEALHLSEEQARAQYKGMPVPTSTWKFQGDDFELIDFNDAAEAYTGGVIRDYLGSKLSIMYAQQAEVRQGIWACYKEQKAIQKQIPFYCMSKMETRHMDVKYAFVPEDMVMIHTEDITDRVLAERQAYDKQLQLQEAQRFAKLGNWDWDLETGKIEWSDEVFRILGYEKGVDEASRENFDKVMHPDDLQLMQECEQRGMQGEPYFDEEWRILTRAGEMKYINLRGDRHFDDQMQTIRMVGTMQDVTERKQVEILKSDFISTISHEIRTPLTSIMGSLSIMENGTVGPFSKEAGKMIRIAYENSQRLLVLINDILDISKIESGKMAFDFQAIAINKFLQQSITANQGYAEHHHVSYVFKTELDDNACVWGDSDRLMQVMNNLLSNAAKFSPQASDIRISATRQNDGFQVAIADCGPGIPEEFSDKIFERFGQVDSTSQQAGGGTGLGLNISKHIVEKHNGNIGYNPRQGGGTEFYFYLPLMN